MGVPSWFKYCWHGRPCVTTATHLLPMNQSQGLTKVMPFALGMFVDVFFGKAGEEDAVEAGVESVQVGAAHVADA